LSIEGNAENLNNNFERWREKLKTTSDRKPSYTTLSQIPVDPLYTPDHLNLPNHANNMDMAGEFPYLRGIHPNGYRSRLWTMRMFAGFGLPEETNKRLKFLLESGQTGLSIAFDMPTLYGYDTDDTNALGEFGKCGVAISTLADMERLFSGIPLGKVTTSMTINSPAAIIWAMYLAVADKTGVPLNQIGGTLQNDILKEYIAQNEYIFPPEPSMRLVVDTIEFATHKLPAWNPISISGYHIREAGSNAVQELAFTLSDGFEYVKHCLARGLNIDDFAPHLSFFFNVHNDFFEEIAKFRAARRIWAEEMKHTFGARNPRSHWLRFHAQTSGAALTAQQPDNNVMRVSLQALAAVLGGCQSLHTNAKDEAWALPSTETALLALRTQQIIAHESGVTDTVDPLGGSYYLESLTNTIEKLSRDYFQRIDDIGGVIPALRSGFLQNEIAEASYIHQLEEDRKERVTVGVNQYSNDDPINMPLLRIDTEGEELHIQELNRIRRTRDNHEVSIKLRDLEVAAKNSTNLMPPLIEAVKSYATLGEMMGVFRQVFGEYQPDWGY